MKNQKKSGVEPSQCTQLVKDILSETKNLQFCGLMTIGKIDAPPENDFQILLNCRKELCEKLSLDIDNVELSMGMSSDYQKAIEMGSSNVRVGSTIFGSRVYHK